MLRHSYVYPFSYPFFFMKGENLGVEKVFAAMGYETKLFDTSMEDWEDFTANCKNEEDYVCSLLIDNEVYKNAAIRGKGKR